MCKSCGMSLLSPYLESPLCVSVDGRGVTSMQVSAILDPLGERDRDREAGNRADRRRGEWGREREEREGVLSLVLAQLRAPQFFTAELLALSK